jgi:hypothetical protein
MKVYRNLTEIQRKERLGRRASLGGMLVLLIGLIASFVPTWYPPGTEVEGAFGQFVQANWSLISFAALPIGFLAASYGSYFITRYARRRWPGHNVIARPDEMVERSFKGVDDKHSLFVYSLPVGYVLAAPTYLLTLVVRSDRGQVQVDGDRWRERWTLGRIFGLFAREGMGNPPQELAEMERKIRTFLSTQGAIEAGVNSEEIPIEGAVIFLSAETRLSLNNPTVPVLRFDEVKDFVRKRAKENRPPAKLMRDTMTFLQQNCTTPEMQAASQAAAVASK